MSSRPNPQSTPIAARRARAAVYLRVSTAKQATRGGEAEGYSIPAQREACHRKAQDLGAEVVDEFVDAGASARSADRPALQALLRRLRGTSDIDYVIVHKVDRLARDRADDVAIGLTIHKAGAVLVSATEAVDDSPAGTLLHGIMASIAEFYSKNLAFEVKKGQLAKAMRGGTPGYTPPGYLNVISRRDGQEVRSVEFDPERAEHIRWAFDAYATGEWSISQLVDELERRGLRTRPTATRVAKPLTRSQVHRLLGSSYFIGRVTYCGVEYEGVHPPLVDETTWQRVQDVRAGRRIAGDRAWKNGHYLLGSLRCDVCDSRIGYTLSTGKTGERYPYFFCLGRTKKRTVCDLPFMRVDDIERKVAQHWQTVTLPAEMIETIRAFVTDELRTARNGASRIVEQQTVRLRLLDAQKQKLIDAYLAEAIPVSDLKQRQAAIGAEIHEAERLIAQFTGQHELAEERLGIALDLLARCHELYLRLGEEERRAFNQAFFKQLYLTPQGGIRTELNAPFANLAASAEHGGSVAMESTSGHRTHDNVRPIHQGRVSNLTYLAELVGQSSNPVAWWELVNRAHRGRSW